jgi:hypothetical protein
VAACVEAADQRAEGDADQEPDQQRDRVHI